MSRYHLNILFLNFLSACVALGLFLGAGILMGEINGRHEISYYLKWSSAGLLIGFFYVAVTLLIKRPPRR